MTGKFVEYKQGWVIFHEWASYTSFVVDPKGPHRIGNSVQEKKFLDYISEAMLRQ
jgi:hypothetical protein